MMQGFELTPVKTGVSSHNHQTRAQEGYSFI